MALFLCWIVFTKWTQNECLWPFPTPPLSNLFCLIVEEVAFFEVPLNTLTKTLPKRKRLASVLVNPPTKDSYPHVTEEALRYPTQNQISFAPRLSSVLWTYSSPLKVICCCASKMTYGPCALSDGWDSQGNRSHSACALPELKRIHKVLIHLPCSCDALVTSTSAFFPCTLITRLHFQFKYQASKEIYVGKEKTHSLHI